VSSRAFRIFSWLALVSAVLVGFYSCSGYVMVGSFSVSNPENLESYRRASQVYLVLMGMSLTVGIAAAVVLVRGARGRARADAT
jgi:hypothetical protein